jgi:predicted alpha-1,2-mannosidase
MNKLFALFIVVLFVASGCSSKKEITDYVDPFIGTDGHGHVFPGATMPFGMVQLSPDTRKDSWDGCSGYHYSDKTIMGFSHTHLSGTGVGDYGDIRIMPTTGKLILVPGTAGDPESGYRSRFSHKSETAKPGFYSVELEDYDIDVELSASQRAGFHHYHFPNCDTANVIIDLVEGVTSDIVNFLQIQFLSDQVVVGVRETDGWAKDQRVFFYAVFSEPFDDFGVEHGKQIQRTKQKVYGKDIKAFVRYYDNVPENLLVKVGISFVDVEGAKQNVLNEIPEWDFNKTVKDAQKSWKEKLQKIEVKGKEEKMTTFYTALYHAYIAPNTFMDVNRFYRGHDGKKHSSTKFNAYTVFSLWDTFRAEHPLMTIIEPDITNDFIKTMLDQYDKGGLLPVWELAGNETNCMIGYHAVPVIYDAYVKGIRGYDTRKSFDAMRRSAMLDQFGLKYYKRYGYIPADKEGAGVSRTLEYAYDDWCIAQMSKDFGYEGLYKKYIERAQYYKNIFDKETGFMRGKRNALFMSPFDPAEVNFTLTEANTWQYNFFVPQDINGLIGLYDGKPGFLNKLDEMFNAEVVLSGRHQADITGLIGQYAHGNEPSHHMAYLYDYAGQPWKTQELIHRICEEQYSDQPDGLCGNEDCGQMSAWYVMSAMGFYQVTPGDPTYAIGSPEFEKVVLHLDNGETFSIVAKNQNENNFYIQSAKMNGDAYNKCFITHEDILKGGKLVFEMGNQANKSWGVADGDYPVTGIADHLITPVPYFVGESHAFTKSMMVEIKDIDEGAKIYYTIDGSAPDENSMVYTQPIKVEKTTTFRAYAIQEGYVDSKVADATFSLIPKGRSLYITNPYSTQYTGGGDIALIDGIQGNNDFRSFGWQGYYGVDFDVVLDLGKVQKVKSVAGEFLQEQRSYIFMPSEMSVAISVDGKNYKQVGVSYNRINPQTEGRIVDLKKVAGINKMARYIKMTARNIGPCPDWHIGAGDKSWIFVDEIIVE